MQCQQVLTLHWPSDEYLMVKNRCKATRCIETFVLDFRSDIVEGISTKMGEVEKDEREVEMTAEIAFIAVFQSICRNAMMFVQINVIYMAALHTKLLHTNLSFKCQINSLSFEKIS